MAETKEKKCRACGLLKPAARYHKKSRSSDGLADWCKDCNAAYQRVRREKIRKGCQDKATNRGIDSQSQINSVLREIAELRLAISNETDTCSRRVDIVKAYSQEALDPWRARIIILQNMVKEFLCKNHTKRNTVFKCEFGSVRLYRNKLDMKVNCKLAAKRSGKP